jgi:raffinose/stachyose/melibiose transport system permease protein
VTTRAEGAPTVLNPGRINLRFSARPSERWATHALLILGSVAAIFPVLLAVQASFKTLYDFYDRPLGLPSRWAWENYVSVWQKAHIPEVAWNSVVVCAISVPAILLVASMAANGLARYRFRGNTAIYLYFLAGLIIPIQLSILPTVLMLKTLGIVNTYAGLILPYIALGMPFSIFVLTGFLRTLPRDLEEAARIDGASEFLIYWRIVLPLCAPALATVAILNFVAIWNDFFFPLVAAPAVPTLQVGVNNLRGYYSTEWGFIFAGVTLSALPLVAAYVLLTKQFIRGIAAGAVRG